MRVRWVPAAQVSGESMGPTLRSGDVVLTRPAWGRVSRGDIVALRRHDNAHYIKRVAAAPGDVVELEAGQLRVNADRAPAATPGAFTARWVVPPGHYFVVGEAAESSADSRTWRQPFVAEHDVLGVVVATMSSTRGLTRARRVPR